MYVINEELKLNFDCGFDICATDFKHIVAKANELYSTIPFNVYKTCGLKSTSFLVSQLFCNAITEFTDSIVNYHESGSPDILPKSASKVHRISDHLKYHTGIEVKCCVGDVLHNNDVITMNKTESRIHKTTSVSWKTRCVKDNENFLGVMWDFINDVPTITAVMGAVLIDSDWTESHKSDVRNINSIGKNKLINNWICFINNEHYIRKYKKIMLGSFKTRNKVHEHIRLSSNHISCIDDFINFN